MAMHPAQVLAQAATSGFFTNVMPPFLFLPLVAWRWTAGIVPIVLLYGASANERLREFGIYYPIVLIPFLALAACVGARRVARRVLPGALAPGAAAAAVVLGSLLVGSTTGAYSLRPWRSEVRQVDSALRLLRDEPRLLVQSGLYPHAGYSSRVELLTREALRDPRNRGALMLMTPSLGAYPLETSELDSVMASGPRIDLPGGLVAVRMKAVDQGP